MIFYDTISWFVISQQKSHTTFSMLMTKKLFSLNSSFPKLSVKKENNKDSTYDSAIEFRHYILEFPNIGRNLY